MRAPRSGSARKLLLSGLLLGLAALAMSCSAPEDPAVIRRRFRDNEEKLEGLNQRVQQLEKRILALEATQYRPGLGELMDGVYRHHRRLWIAGSAGDWERAAFELQEVRESLEDVQKLYPRHEKLPKGTGEMIGEILSPSLDAVKEALNAKDPMRFETSYQELCSACTSCHQAAGLSFLVITKPTGAAPNPPTPKTQERVAPAIPVRPGEEEDSDPPHP